VPLIHVIAGTRRLWLSATQGGGVNMVVEQDEAQAQTLQDLVERALKQADAIGDYLIAALLSQCLVLMQKSPPPEH
jgi:hypothetical protein